MFKFLEKLFLPNKIKNEILIADYWEKRRLEQIEEKKYTNHTPEHNGEHINRVINDLELIGVTDIMLYAEGRRAPQLVFNYDGKEYYSSPIYNIDYDIIMGDIKKIINIE